MRAYVVYFALVFSLSRPVIGEERWDALYNQAVRELEAGQYEAAITKLQAAISQNPKSGSALRADATKTVRYFPYFLLGKAYFHVHKYDEASRYFAQESRSNLPDKLFAAITYYQEEIRSIEERKRRDDFDRALATSEAARSKGAFGQAAEELEKARQTDPAEFEKRDLGKLLASVRASEKQRAVEAERQRTEAAFQELIRQASDKEKQGTFSETTALLEKAEQLIPGRNEVKALTNRIREREDKYASAKQAASTAEQQGRVGEAITALKQAEQANPEKYKAEKLSEWAGSLAREATIQEHLKAGSQALELGQFAQAVENYDLVLQVDPESITAKTGKSRAQFLQLLARGDELAIDGAFPDALQAFELARSQNAGQGSEVYDRMQLHLPVIQAGRSAIRSDWLEVMRNSDPERFTRERPGRAAPRRPLNMRTERPAPSRQEDVRRGVLAALNEEPQEAVRMLEKARATQRGGNAELESWTGVAYARLSFLSADPKRKEEFRARATEHFRRARDLDPRYQLNSRLVPPRILKLFADAGR